MNTMAFEQFEIMNDQVLSAVKGGKFGAECLGYGVTALSAGAGALGALSTGAGAPLGLYLGAQALGTAATVATCLS